MSLFSPTILLRRLLTDSKYFWWLSALVIVGDAVLTGLIIKFVPYTEIDWETYMVQLEVYLGGERNYSKITGPTGPLVYPAGHVHIHKLLYNITTFGKNLRSAQYIYGLLYILSLVLSCAIYWKAGTMPNWVVLLLPLSKRLHSIFVLRLFNDCWAVVLVQLAMLLFQSGLDDTAVLIYSAALSVKMSILLYLPGLLLILFKRRGLASTLRYVLTIAGVQAVIAVPFLEENPWAYIRSAFDLGRVFLYKWTVNWRFVSEEVFLGRQWALGLLVGHLCTLVGFGLFRWCQEDGGAFAVVERGLRRPLSPAGISRVTGDYVATVLFTSNLIGMLFARSLHYQFYSWYAQQIPFLLWKTRFPVLIRLLLCFVIEYAWNTYPSTTVSSALLLLANVLLVLGVWSGTRRSKRVVATKQK
ncbi:glycosyltransferase family 58 protein [Amanita thiersii Skay4041]|uniref:Dol-P-Man:Man(5)GlcNAc(2)-PP-Dol alpha-1,3-mannosyltransferase n=1 Tax=Amanita thiersii Skay4041 TaxID=703135 RepID=A0A2A9NSY2_9AGAR|nr:glycosyltransferase family 58 protein [Amanita thiersii Skay4041]